MSEAVIKIEDAFIQTIQKTVDSASSLKELKLSGLKKFQELGVPGRKSEAYKYTPIERLLSKNFEQVALATSSWSKAECQAKFYAIENANHLVIIDGKFEKDFSIVKSESSEMIIDVINDSTFRSIEQLKNSLGQTRAIENDAFAQFNQAGFENGLYIQTKRNLQAKDTFVYHFISSENADSISFPRILINSESGSTLNVFEKTFAKGNRKALVISAFEGNVAPNAELRYTKTQQYGENIYSVEGIYAHQAKDSRFYTNTFTFSGSMTRNNVFISIDGENCEAHMHGLYHLSGKDHIDNNTTVDHMKPHSFSNELYKGILDEQSRGVFNGKIYVRPDAQKTNAFQSNNNILLSEGAVINTKPQLEIWADDVKCSHGCTTGQLDEEAIFYLRARGVDKKSARALMLNAFANEVLSQVKNETVVEEIEGIILNKLGQ